MTPKKNIISGRSPFDEVRKQTKDYTLDADDKTFVSEFNRFKGSMFKGFFADRKKSMVLPFKERRALDVKASQSYLITMMFNNGTLKTFVVTTEKSTFKMGDKSYYLYYEESWFDLTSNMYHLYYHEGQAVPINREVKRDGNSDYFVVTPENLKPLIDFEYVKVLAGNIGLDKALKTIIILSAVSLLLNVVKLFISKTI